MTAPMGGMSGARRNASSRLDSMGLGVAGNPAAGEGKQPMGAVRYRAAEVPAQSCGDCVHFQPPAVCELVAGNIDPMATCDLFAPEGPGQETGPEPFEDQAAAAGPAAAPMTPPR